MYQDESRRPEFMTSGLLKSAPLALVDISQLHTDPEVKSQFRHPISTTVEVFSDPWHTSCPVSSKPALATMY
jgi:hypothetical protein